MSMKRLSLLIILIAFISLAYTGCRTVAVTNSSRGSSPGQMKKETGSQSAKPYAPGQVKKETGSKCKHY